MPKDAQAPLRSPILVTVAEANKRPAAVATSRLIRVSIDFLRGLPDKSLSDSCSAFYGCQLLLLLLKQKKKRL